MKLYITEFFRFIFKLARACLFAIIFFACLYFGKYITTFGLHLYDFLFVCVIITQIILLATKIETRDEIKIILIYHLLGFVMELFKTHPSVGSREYPDPWFFTIGWVPLYSGFMYSAVGSFIFQWREQLKLRFTNFPPFYYTIPIATLIYINFFTHHFIRDLRYILVVAIMLVSYKTSVYFTINKLTWRMPVLLWLTLVWFFMWVAENLATFWWARVYPHQDTWRTFVSRRGVLSWFLLFIVSFVIVSTYKMKPWKKTEKNMPQDWS